MNDGIARTTNTTEDVSGPQIEAQRRIIRRLSIILPIMAWSGWLTYQSGADSVAGMALMFGIGIVTSPLAAFALAPFIFVGAAIITAVITVIDAVSDAWADH